jgi:hypothetical protein
LLPTSGSTPARSAPCCQFWSKEASCCTRSSVRSCCCRSHRSCCSSCLSARPYRAERATATMWQMHCARSQVLPRHCQVQHATQTTCYQVVSVMPDWLPHDSVPAPRDQRCDSRLATSYCVSEGLHSNNAAAASSVAVLLLNVHYQLAPPASLAGPVQSG